MLQISDIHLHPAAKAMGLHRVPLIEEIGDPDLATGNFFKYQIDLNLKALSSESLYDDRAALVEAVEWDRRLPVIDFVKFIIAHEMGHNLQGQEFGALEVGHDYAHYVYPIQVRFASAHAAAAVKGQEKLDPDVLLELEREYHATPYEADADMTAYKYYHLIEIA